MVFIFGAFIVRCQSDMAANSSIRFFFKWNLTVDMIYISKALLLLNVALYLMLSY